MLKIILLFLPLSVLALSEHILEYDLSRGGFSLGTEKRELSKQGDIYSYTARAKTEGFAKFILDYQIKAKSDFSIDNTLIAHSFQLKEIEDGKIKKDINLIFTDDGIHSNNTIWHIQSKALDNLSIFLALSYDLKHNNPLHYRLADGKNIKTYQFSALKNQTMQVLDKETTVIKVSDNNNLVAYFAPDYDYLPVLIQKKNWQYKLKSLQFK
jgi:hypothetical protein